MLKQTDFTLCDRQTSVNAYSLILQNLVSKQHLSAHFIAILMILDLILVTAVLLFIC